MRDRIIDTARGLLVLLMVWCHTMQFFADTQIFPLAQTIIDAINATVFPSFVFCFGYTAWLAYLQKPYRRALPGMLRTALRAYAAFVLSGAGYRVLREGKALSWALVRRILLLEDIPGWSEFLVSFSLYALLTALAFRALRALAGRPVPTLLVGTACLLASLLPCERVSLPQAALLIGGTQFACFPIVQYMPFFLAGLLATSGGRRERLALAGLAAAVSAPMLLHLARGGALPQRFPPSPGWLALSALPVCMVMLAAKGLCQLPDALEPLRAALANLGARSLYYLLTSNLAIFILAGRGIVPQYAKRSLPPFNLTIQSPWGALGWTAALLSELWFIARLAGRGAAGK
ncbi:MAG: heparan-alpha-glucosaminide N-acetyltransferase domain-containing protein [Clostridiales bacterium]|nr:heparan-alpha-glucosaminide N-acetyltransferase domain-containing protein [Clostridiales bacterium]